MELTAVLGRQSHSPTVTVPQDHLPLNLTLKVCFTLEERLFSPKKPHQPSNNSIQLQFAKMQRHFIIKVYCGHLELG